MRRGQVYYVDLGQPTGSEQGGKRPCVIIQNDVGNEYSQTTIIVPMTTKNKKYLPAHVETTGEDYFKVGNSEIRKNRIIPISDNDFTDKILVVESGYLMLVKSFTDDLAWEVQRQLVNSYFRAKKLSQVEMMRIQLGMIDGLGERLTDVEKTVENIKDTMTIDYGQQRVIEDTVNKTVIDALGGKQSNAYRKIGRKVFAECNHDLKSFFNVNSRNNIPKLRFDEAVEYAKNWKPCTNTQMLINEHNAQMTI